jgi:F0F1-type ATP synthase membrane subunit c/vacuolar-type H+-ATPase subunit K
MAQFQSDASTYFWLGVAIALAGCLAAQGIKNILKHYFKKNPGFN